METSIVYWGYIWVVVKIMVPFWVPIIIRHPILMVPQKGTIILTTTHIGIIQYRDDRGLSRHLTPTTEN